MAEKKALRLKLNNYTRTDHFGVMMGFEVTQIDRKKHRAAVRLHIEERHISPAGKVHGGAIAALMDHACGAAVFSTLGPNDFCSTVELKTHFFSPLELGMRVTAKAEVVFRGKRLAVVHVMLYSKGRKDPVAMATGTLNVVAT